MVRPLLLRSGNLFSYNLRFPGQLYDSETKTHYNYFRDSYAPDVGRYYQSDPIGLIGGINTYGYVGGNPLKYSDPRGLTPLAFCIPPPGAVACAAFVQVCAQAVRKIAFYIAKGIAFNIIDCTNNGSCSASDSEGEDPVVYPDNPDTKREDFKDIRGTRGKLTPDGSVWERDTSQHGSRDGDGSQWKRWPDKSSWEKGKKPQSIWPDGRIRK